MKIKLSKHRFNKTHFSRFLSISSKYSTPLFTIFYLKNHHQRYAFICPKKIGTSVVRNKMKRRLKEIFLLNSKHISNQYSIIIMLKSEIIKSSFQNSHNMVLLCLKKLKIIHENT